MKFVDGLMIHSGAPVKGLRRCGHPSRHVEAG